MSTDIRSIVAKVQAGDREAFAEIIQEYQSRLRMLMRVLLRDRSLVDDMTQEVFVTAYLRIDTYDPSQGDFYVWVKGIARNLAARVNRRIRKGQEVRENYLAELTRDQGFRDDRAGGAWLDAATERLRTCLERLPAKIQELFRKIYRDEMPIGDVARAESMSPSAVKVAVYRGRLLLKVCLESGGYSP